MVGCEKCANLTPKVTQNIISTWGNSNYYQIPADAFDCVKSFYYRKDTVQKFIDNHVEMLNQYAAQKVDFDILEQHPVLGVCHSGHAYFEKPLYRHVSLTEPQFTKALAQFFNEEQNQKICRAFVQAIFETLHKQRIINKTIKCACEIQTQDVRNPKAKRKRIDNIFIWDNEMLCLEIKFDAQLTNLLEVYQEECQKIAKKNKITNIEYVVISKICLQKNIDEYIQTLNRRRMTHKFDKWQNILWRDVLKEWEEIIIKQNIDEDLDMKRYRTSLWYKILNKES